MNDGQNQDALSLYAINQAVAIDKALTNIRLTKFGHDSAQPRKLT